jgi:hypothetical protein
MKYAKTESGQLAFRQRSSLLSARQRSAFILFDGNKSLDQVAAVVGVTQTDVDHLLGQGFVVPAEPVQSQVNAEPVVAGDPLGPGLRTQQERHAQAMRMATALTAGLGLRGFRLNLAIESAPGYEGLVKLLPELRKALGAKACEPLERVLNA